MQHHIYETFNIGSEETQISNKVNQYTTNTSIQIKNDIASGQTVIDNIFLQNFQGGIHYYNFEKIPEGIEYEGEYVYTFPIEGGISNSIYEHLILNNSISVDGYTFELIRQDREEDKIFVDCSNQSLWEQGTFQTNSFNKSNSTTRLRLINNYIPTTAMPANTKVVLTGTPTNTSKILKFVERAKYIDDSIQASEWTDNSLTYTLSKDATGFNFLIAYSNNATIQPTAISTASMTFYLPNTVTIKITQNGIEENRNYDISGIENLVITKEIIDNQIYIVIQDALGILDQFTTEDQAKIIYDNTIYQLQDTNVINNNPKYERYNTSNT